MLESLNGRAVIVTGAGRGLGRAMTLGLLAAGAGVTAVDVDAQALEDMSRAAHSNGAGDRLLVVTADITRDDIALQIVRQTLHRFGQLDVLVNNAGTTSRLLRDDSGPKPPKFWEVLPADFRRVIDVNVVAPFLLMRAALEPMLARHWGRIVNVTTSLDTMWRGNIQPYGGSKAANEAHLLAMSLELEGTGVTANVLIPGGPADTRMIVTAPHVERSALISPDVMVPPLIWLASPESDGITGQRFIAAHWDRTIPKIEAAKKAGAPAAWQQLGKQSIHPDNTPRYSPAREPMSKGR
ncbi:MAG: SDR family oxidoreductase [Xanthobacteraceae bacterium]|nr:SDR family oxidoreductase [Xanthobacteraceae bacterium]